MEATNVRFTQKHQNSIVLLIIGATLACSICLTLWLKFPFNLQHATYISLGLGAVPGAILGNYFDKKQQKENRQ